jgi:hypothetical protein
MQDDKVNDENTNIKVGDAKLKERILIIDDPMRKALKVWCEKSQSYYYKARDPNYYNEYFHAHKREMSCVYCGKVVTSQMYSHLKSLKCQLVQKKLELEKLKSNGETNN